MPSRRRLSLSAVASLWYGNCAARDLFPVFEGIVHRVESIALGRSLGHHHHWAECDLQERFLLTSVSGVSRQETVRCSLR